MKIPQSNWQEAFQSTEALKNLGAWNIASARETASDNHPSSGENAQWPFASTVARVCEGEDRDGSALTT